jgi:hypothetical protein
VRRALARTKGKEVLRGVMDLELSPPIERRKQKRRIEMETEIRRKRYKERTNE